MDVVDDFDERLELFFGECSDTQCRVYARLSGIEPQADLRLTGTLTGPTCVYAQTLPARFTFHDCGPGKSLLAEAVVPEPCFWTPELPQLYEAEVLLRRGSQPLASIKRPFGIRRLGASGRDLIFDSKRWVLRGIRREESPAADLAAWRAASAVMVVRNPSDELCQEASRVGVLLVARLKASEADQIRRLSRWPAVGTVAITAPPSFTPPEASANLLLAQEFVGIAPLRPEPWAQVLLYDEVNLRRANVDPPPKLPAALSEETHEAVQRELSKLNRPLPQWIPLVHNPEPSPSREKGAEIVDAMRPVIVTQRLLPQMPSVDSGRRWCDQLQRSLAERNDLVGCEFAGYIV